MPSFLDSAHSLPRKAVSFLKGAIEIGTLTFAGKIGFLCFQSAKAGGSR